MVISDWISDVCSSDLRIYPFIELTDLALKKGEPPSVAIITAINVGARFGIRVRPVAIEATPDFVDALATMTVTTLDDQGRELSRASGSDILGHPFNAVVWLDRKSTRLNSSH